jgi:cytochrome c
MHEKFVAGIAKANRGNTIGNSDPGLRYAQSGLRALSLAFFAAILAGDPAGAADAAHGKVVFQTCAACHTDKPDAIGPSLRGVYGRKAGSLEDFRYSSAMVRANIVWDQANLRAYIKDPQAKVPGNRMPFGGIDDPKDVDDVIAYLKALN